MTSQGRKAYNQYASKSFYGGAWWNATRPKYTKPTKSHDTAVARIKSYLQDFGYEVYTEYYIDLREGGEGFRGIKNKQYPIDIFAENHEPNYADMVFIQVDGEYHRSRDIQPGKTKNRNIAQKTYAADNGIRFITITTAEANDLSNEQLYDKLLQPIGWAE